MINESAVKVTLVWHPDDFNGKPYKNRPDLFATMKIEDEILMWAPTYVEYASIRSSAYGFARRKRWKFYTKRMSPNIVRVTREI